MLPCARSPDIKEPWSCRWLCAVHGIAAPVQFGAHYMHMGANHLQVLTAGTRCLPRSRTQARTAGNRFIWPCLTSRYPRKQGGNARTPATYCAMHITLRRQPSHRYQKHETGMSDGAAQVQHLAKQLQLPAVVPRHSTEALPLTTSSGTHAKQAATQNTEARCRCSAGRPNPRPCAAAAAHPDHCSSSTYHKETLISSSQ